MRPTVGRDEELELVDRFLGRVPGGTPILVIEGDPGIGKTTVWLEAIRRGEARSFRLLKASPAESEAKLPYAALGDLVGEAFAKVGSALPAPHERAFATALLLADSDEPADARTTATAVQWLDAASKRVLALAARRLPENADVLLSWRSQPLGKLPITMSQHAARWTTTAQTGRSMSEATRSRKAPRTHRL